MKEFADIDFTRTYGEPPESFKRRVQSTLGSLQAQPGPRRVRWALVLAAVLALALATAGLAAVLSPTVDIFGWFYGRDMASRLMEGEVAPAHQRCRLGDVVYTLDDVIWLDGSIYGTGTIQAAEGAGVVLLPEDYSVDEPMGYTLHYGEDTLIPDDAPTYAEAAQGRGARIVAACCVAEGLVEQDGTLNASEIGYSEIPQADGSIRFTLEFTGGPQADRGVSHSPLERADQYVLRLYLSNWEVTPEGEALRDEEYDTYLYKQWDVTVASERKEE